MEAVVFKINRHPDEEVIVEVKRMCKVHPLRCKLLMKELDRDTALVILGK